MVAIALLANLGACGRCGSTAVVSESMVVASDARSAWPRPSPDLPSVIADVAWPTTTAELRAKHPALFAEGKIAGDLLILATDDPTPTLPRIWIAGTEITERNLIVAWGPPSRASGYAIWLAPDRGLKARFPAKHLWASSREGVELAPYVSTMERIHRAPEQLIEMGPPLLGRPASALDGYAPWIVSRDPSIAILDLPPGEWDLGATRAIVTVTDGIISRIKLLVMTGQTSVTATEVREALQRRFGAPRTTSEAGMPTWRYPGPPEVLLQDNGHLAITYFAK